MSVPVEKRKQGKLLCIIAAERLCTHSYRITSNENIFVTKYSRLVDKVCDTATDIYAYAEEANDIRVTDAEGWHRRSALQKMSIEKCNRLLKLIQICKPVFHLRIQKVRYWGMLVLEAKNGLTLWHEADKKRYARFK